MNRFSQFAKLLDAILGQKLLICCLALCDMARLVEISKLFRISHTA